MTLSIRHLPARKRGRKRALGTLPDPVHESAWLRKAGSESAPEIFRFLTLAILGPVCCAPMVSGKWLAVMESGA